MFWGVREKLVSLLDIRFFCGLFVFLSFGSVADVQAQKDFCSVGFSTGNLACAQKNRQEIQKEALDYIQSRWWHNPGVSSSSGFFGEVAERAGGSVGSLVLGQTAHQAGDVLEGLFFLVTLRPGRALDHLSNGLNPLGLANSVLSDLGACAESPFCDRGFLRPTIKVGLQNISQMFRSHADHPVNPMTAPFNPGKHVGIYQQEFGSVLNWGGELNFEKPLYLENVYDSRDQSEFMALERLQCAFSSLKSHLSLADDYYLLGYNCGGFVADALEIAGLQSPYMANCGIGQELRITGPSANLKALIKYKCDSKADLVPKMLKKIELGETLEKKEIDALQENEFSTQFYIQAIISAVRAKNVSNLYFLSGNYFPPVETELFGDIESLSSMKGLEALKDLAEAYKKFNRNDKQLKNELREIENRKLEVNWPPSDYATRELGLIFRGLGQTEVSLLKLRFNRVFEALQYYCRHWVNPDYYAGTACPFVEFNDDENKGTDLSLAVERFELVYSINYFLEFQHQDEYLQAWRQFGGMPLLEAVSLNDIQQLFLIPHFKNLGLNQMEKLALDTVYQEEKWRLVTLLLDDLMGEDAIKKSTSEFLLRKHLEEGNWAEKISGYSFLRARKNLVRVPKNSDPSVKTIVHAAYVSRILEELRKQNNRPQVNLVWQDGFFRFLQWGGLFETLKTDSLVFKENTPRISDDFFEEIKFQFLEAPVSDLAKWQLVFRDFGRIGESLLTGNYLDIRDKIVVWFEMKIHHLQTQGHDSAAQDLQKFLDTNLQMFR